MTNTETVSTERLALQAIKDRLQSAFGAGVWNMPSPNLNGASRWEHQQAALFSIIETCDKALREASRTQSPAEWQVEAILKWVHEDVLPAYGITLEYRDAEMVEGAKEALRAASITPPAPERSKEEVGVLSVADALAQLSAAIEAEKQRNTVRDEMLATVIVNLEKSELTAEFAVLLRDYVRAERAKLSALETPPLHKEGEVEYVTVDHKGCIFHSKDMDGIARIAKANLEAAVAAAVPVPVPMTITQEMIERAAIGIYEEAPSIGLDCECGWRDQTPQYKQKARMIARAALTAALSKPGEQG